MYPALLGTDRLDQDRVDTTPPGQCSATLAIEVDISRGRARLLTLPGQHWGVAQCKSVCSSREGGIRAMIGAPQPGLQEAASVCEPSMQEW